MRIILRWNRTRVDNKSDVRIVHSNDAAGTKLGMIIVCSATVNKNQSVLSPSTFEKGAGSNTARLDYVYALTPNECATRIDKLLNIKYVNNAAPITSIVANQDSGVQVDTSSVAKTDLQVYLTWIPTNQDISSAEVKLEVVVAVVDCAGDLNNESAADGVYVTVDNRSDVYVTLYPSRPHDFQVVAQQYHSLKLKLW